MKAPSGARVSERKSALSKNAEPGGMIESADRSSDARARASARVAGPAECGSAANTQTASASEAPNTPK